MQSPLDRRDRAIVTRICLNGQTFTQVAKTLRMKRGEVQYDFVEVMACPGGCAGGGGQPIHDGLELASSRGSQLWKMDAKMPIRFSHENPDVQALYREFLKKPLGEKPHHLLHTDHTAWTAEGSNR